MEQYNCVITTCGSEEEAESIGKLLLKERYIACMNIIKGVNSFFHWQDKIDNEIEVLLLMKTQNQHVSDVMKLIKKHHSYDLPEIIVLPIINGSPEYLQWIKKETTR